MFNETKELDRVERARAARVSARLEAVAAEVAKTEAAPVEDVRSLVSEVVRSAAGPRRLSADE